MRKGENKKEEGKGKEREKEKRRRGREKEKRWKGREEKREGEGKEEWEGEKEKEKREKGRLKHFAILEARQGWEQPQGPLGPSRVCAPQVTSEHSARSKPRAALIKWVNSHPEMIILSQQQQQHSMARHRPCLLWLLPSLPPKSSNLGQSHALHIFQY